MSQGESGDRLVDEVALVTGASSGIGRETARTLARNGAAVAVVARREPRLREVAEAIENEFDTSACAVSADLTDETQVKGMVETIVGELGEPNIVVNNAGVMRSGNVDELSTDAYATMMAVNTDGVFFSTRAVLEHLRDSNGNLVFIGSNAGVYPYPPNPVYAATKWWLRGFAHSLAASYGDEISVSVINPSTTRTEIGRQDGPPNVERFEPGEKLEPIDIAEAVAYAVEQNPPAAVNELNLFQQDELGQL